MSWIKFNYLWWLLWVISTLCVRSKTVVSWESPFAILKKELTLENQFQQILMTETKPLNKTDYKHFHTITTRWNDNDVYGHINNVTYYSYFDTAVNHYLINTTGLDIHNASIVGFVVNSQCNYCSNCFSRCNRNWTSSKQNRK